MQRRYAKDPAAMMRETARFYRVRGIRQVDPAGLLGGLAQAPVFTALFAALKNGLGSGIRFLWISDTALPNLLLTLIVGSVTVTSIAASPAAAPDRTAQILTLAMMGGMTIWFLSSTSALVRAVDRRRLSRRAVPGLAATKTSEQRAGGSEQQAVSDWRAATSKRSGRGAQQGAGCLAPVFSLTAARLLAASRCSLLACCSLPSNR